MTVWTAYDESLKAGFYYINGIACAVDLKELYYSCDKIATIGVNWKLQPWHFSWELFVLKT